MNTKMKALLFFSVLTISLHCVADNLIFIHHSCGENWLNSGLETTLEGKAYITDVNEIYYGTTVPADSGRPDSLGDTEGDQTDMCHWVQWFNDYLDGIKAQGSGSNTIVMFKSCYPASGIGSDGTEPGDPFSSSKTLVNYKAVYRHFSGSGNTYSYMSNTYQPLEDIFAAHPEVLFIPVTAPSLVPNDTNADHADRARVWNNYLKTDWLSSYNTAHPTLNNVAVFDWFDVLAYANDYAGADRNMTKSEYRSSESDSHPNGTANTATTAVFASNPVNFIDTAYNAWKATAVKDWRIHKK